MGFMYAEKVASSGGLQMASCGIPEASRRVDIGCAEWRSRGGRAETFPGTCISKTEKIRKTLMMIMAHRGPVQ